MFNLLFLLFPFVVLVLTIIRDNKIKNNTNDIASLNGIKNKRLVLKGFIIVVSILFFALFFYVIRVSFFRGVGTEITEDYTIIYKHKLDEKLGNWTVVDKSIDNSCSEFCESADTSWYRWRIQYYDHYSNLQYFDLRNDTDIDSQLYYESLKVVKNQAENIINEIIKTSYSISIFAYKSNSNYIDKSYNPKDIKLDDVINENRYIFSIYINNSNDFEEENMDEVIDYFYTKFNVNIPVVFRDYYFNREERRSYTLCSIGIKKIECENLDDFLDYLETNNILNYN